MIPEAAVEAALIAFSDEIAKVGARHKDALRAALEAAASHIRAKALTDAAESWQVRMDTTGRGSADAKLFMQQRAAIERVAK